MKYSTIKQIAKKWGISERRIVNLCREHRIAGAYKNGMFWNIPEDASKPSDNRRKTAKYLKTNKTIIIAGINSELGYETCNVLNKEGNNVIGLYQQGTEIQKDRITNIKTYEIDYSNTKDLIQTCEKLALYIDGLVIFDTSFIDNNMQNLTKSYETNIIVSEILIDKLITKMNCDSSIVFVSKSNQIGFGVDSLTQNLSTKYTGYYGVRINSLVVDYMEKNMKLDFAKKIIANIEGMAQDIKELLTEFKSTTGVTIKSNNSEYELDENLNTSFLTLGKYYKIIDRIYNKVEKGSLIWSPSIMQPDEWIENYGEIKFAQNNLDAANRGVIIDRVFIFKRSDIKKIKNNIIINMFMQNKNIKTSYMDYEKLKEKRPDLLKIIQNGWVGINQDTLIVDLPYKGSEYRGYISVNKDKIKETYNCFQELKKYTNNLKELLK